MVIYNFRKELVERLLTEGYEVYISSPYGERIEDLREMGCHYIEANIERHGLSIINDFKLILYYIKVIKKIRPYKILTYTIKPNIYGGLASSFMKIPYIANITGLGTAVENESLLQKFLIALYKVSFKNISKVFFQNQENMNFFVKYKIALGKHNLVPGSGVNLKQFSVIEYPKEETIKFLFISRIMKEKGIEEYLQVAEYFYKNKRNTEFHILGFCEEEYEERLNKLTEEGIIKYHGMQRDVRKFHEFAHCTIHPSYYPEGISNVLLESAASGRPLITTKRSGCRETLDDGVSGYLINERDSKDLIQKIDKFLNLTYEEKKQMGLNGRRKVEKEFDRQIVVEAYMEEVVENQ